MVFNSTKPKKSLDILHEYEWNNKCSSWENTKRDSPIEREMTINNCSREEAIEKYFNSCADIGRAKLDKKKGFGVIEYQDTGGF